MNFIEEWDVSEEKVDKLLSYLESTWIGKLIVTARTRTNPVRKPPMFSHKLWNKFDTVKEDLPLTNNSSEGFNSAQKLSMGKNPNLWYVCQTFRDEDSLVQLKLRDAAVGNSPVGANNGRATKFREQKRKLRNLVQNYENLSIEDYMNYALKFYNNELVL